jgi:isopenicillin-N epimerase
MVLPVREIIAALDPSVSVMVDGAHGPGMLDLSINGLGADFYVGSCHKWLCAPRGVSFVWASPEHRAYLFPPAASPADSGNGWFASSTVYHSRFDWTGTIDPSAFLTVPAAIDSGIAHGTRGWLDIRDFNRSLAIAARQLISNKLELELLTPDSMTGAMSSFMLPARRAKAQMQPWELEEVLFKRARARVAAYLVPDSADLLLRISCYTYNTIHDYELLAEVIEDQYLMR